MAAPLNEEPLDLDDVDLEAAETGHVCTLCTESIRLTDEVFLLRVVHPFIIEGELTYFDIIDNQGFYKYPPAFFCFDCWEDEQEEVQKIQEDVPAVSDPAGIILCDICQSDVLQGEAMGLVQLGEQRLSERQPSGSLSVVFYAIDNSPLHLCIACLTHFEENQQDRIWSDEIEPVPNHEVCVEGLFERCWRGGGCACPKRICER